MALGAPGPEARLQARLEGISARRAIGVMPGAETQDRAMVGAGAASGFRPG